MLKDNKKDSNIIRFMEHCLGLMKATIFKSRDAPIRDGMAKF